MVIGVHDWDQDLIEEKNIDRIIQYPILPVTHEVSILSNSSIFNPASIAHTLKIPIGKN